MAMTEMRYLSDAESAVHSATKFAHFWGSRSDHINSAQWSHTGIVNALKALAIRECLPFDHESTLLEMMDVFISRDRCFFESRGIDEVILLHVCNWSLLSIHDGGSAPDKEMLLEAVEIAQTLIKECAG